MINCLRETRADSSPTHRRELAAEFGSRVRFSEELALVPERPRRSFAEPIMTGSRFNVEWGGIRDWTVRIRRAVQVSFTQPVDSRRGR